MEKEFLHSLMTNPDITVELVGRWIWISGDTKPLKEQLKENNFRWSLKKQMWYYHKGKYRRFHNREMSMDEIKMKYPSQTLRRTETA